MAVGASPRDTEILLSTKFRMPRPRRDYVVRRGLFEQLRRCADMSVVFVKGAAGMGKTTLVSSFFKETGRKPAAWLSLDDSLNSVFSFWTYFLAAAGLLLDERADPAPLFLGGRGLREELAFLINRLCGETDYYLVLDDFHVITDPPLIESLDYFLRSMPENLHLFLLSREEPPVYLGALAVSGRLLYVSGEDMKFSDEESLRFLKNTMKLNADDAELRKISRFAEGWVGGLQLAAAGGDLSGGLLRQGGGFAAEYLTREVFAKLLPAEQEFLVGTGALSWFSAAIASAVFGPLDFSAMLDSLLKKNLFLICVDEEKGIYRYHNILGEYLGQRFRELPMPRQREILHRAADGFAAAGDTGEAARLLIEAADYESAGAAVLKMKMDSEAGRYVARLPTAFVVRNLDLLTRGIIYHIDCGDMPRFDALCDAALARWKDLPLCALLRYARGILSGESGGEKPGLISAADIESLHLRPETAALILIGVANLLLMDRRYTLAVQYADRAQEFVPRAGSETLQCHIYAMKAQLDEETGRLNESLENYRRIAELFDRAKPAFMSRYDYLIGIAGVYLKRMELPRAKEVLDEARGMLRGKHIPDDMVRFSLVYNDAEYAMLSGQAEQGAALVRDFIGSGAALRRADRLLIELSQAGRMPPELGERILAEYTLCRERGQSVSPAFELLCARLYFQRGDAEAAQRITQAVLAFSREAQNRLRLTEADLLLLWMTDAQTPAGRRRRHNLLREAVYYAWENRILQPFYLEKDRLAPLWKEFAAALSDRLGEGERRFVRDAMRLGGETDAPGGLLSPREREVLAQMGKHKTNPQIAEALYISLATVKSHALSIYGKLGVSSREEAVDEARRLGLL